MNAFQALSIFYVFNSLFLIDCHIQGLKSIGIRQQKVISGRVVILCFGIVYADFEQMSSEGNILGQKMQMPS